MPEFTGAGWDRLNDQVERVASSPRNKSIRIDRLTTRVPVGFRQLAMKAARRRGLSLEAYLRRSIAAVMVHDLGLDWWELLADEPWTAVYGAGLREVKPLAGAEFGPWHVDGMSDPP
jgi:hypothetical protein